MKRILGLDLGSASIGWALIEEDEKGIRIIALGSRIIPYNGTEGQDFAKGAGESRNSLRTQARTTRKGYDRYQLRRKYLVNVLVKNSMMPSEDLRKMPKMNLWQLRSKAVTEDISRQELGRLLLWLNQKRGYKSSRSDANLDKKDTDYVKEVKSRFDKIKERNQTIGQYFYEELQRDEYFRVKENVFPREAYIAEFDAICSRQKEHLGLSEELITEIRNEIIYYQRPLKSQKGLVSVCDFEGKWMNQNGKELFIGPKVAHKSSPLFQLAKIWESVNNIKLSTKYGDTIELTLEEKKQLVDYLDNNEKLTAAALFKILHKDKKEYILPKQLEKGLQGNITKCKIADILGGKYEHLLQLNLEKQEAGTPCYLYTKSTGEVLGEKPLQYIDKSVEKELFYQLWHTIYSISDEDECCKALQKRFDIDAETAGRLAKIDFSKYGFGNKSAKAIRKILPYLMEGDKYSDAMCYAGYNHSNSLTKEENHERKLNDKLKLLAKNSLRQPIVEKIMNQMIQLVNTIIDKYGKPDEIRLELARELKQSKEERNDADKAMSKRQRENKEAEKKLEEHGIRATRNNILKYRLFEEMGEKKHEAICIYCGNPVSFSAAMNGDEVDVEHIIPRSKLFDDSQSNKTLAHRKCNANKNDMTAYDFMKTKSKQDFDKYVERVNQLYADRIISRSKYNKLLMAEDDIPSNFIDRQLRESQYIATKAREILQTICYNVWSTSGTVTAELRHLWGWDDITMNLQMPKYKELGLTEMVEWTSDHGKNVHSKEVITGWTKRDDHRHHAIDALTIACTKQGFIQRFNTLSSSKTRDDMQKELEKCSIQFREKRSLLEKYIISQRPISVSDVAEAVSRILISFKAGKKVATIGKRKVNGKVVQQGIVVPRGALSEDSVYGKIRTIVRKMPVKYLFENPDLIFKPYIKALVKERLAEFDNDKKQALASLKKNPVYLDKQKTKLLEYGTCFKDEYVKKYDVNPNFTKIADVIDGKVKQILEDRLGKFGGKPKEAFKDVVKGDKTLKWYEDEGLERPIRSVRCLTGLSAVVPVKKDENGTDIGFVKPGNNHHVAIYVDADGKGQEHLCTFWNAVERKKYGLPIIIKDANEVWDKITMAGDDVYPQSFLSLLPKPDWTLKLSLQQNEMLILGMEEDEVKYAIESKDYKLLSDYLYRVQKLSSSNYVFRHHLETQIVDNDESKMSKRFFNTRSLNALFALNPFKVRIDCLGNIIPS